MNLGRSLLFLFLATVAAPAFVMVDFLLERDRILREVCVQRVVPEKERTCHGQCHLAKQLKEVSNPEKELPSVPTIRFELQFVGTDDTVHWNGAQEELLPTYPGERAAALLNGHPDRPEGVPWC